MIYKEVKSVNERLDFIEDLAEEVIINQLPKARLTSSQSKEIKKRIAEMRRGNRTPL
ncbi:MAG: addiction module protein [Nitrososphaerales archaeon]